MIIYANSYVRYKKNIKVKKIKTLLRHTRVRITNEKREKQFSISSWWWAMLTSVECWHNRQIWSLGRFFFLLNDYERKVERVQCLLWRVIKYFLLIFDAISYFVVPDKKTLKVFANKELKMSHRKPHRSFDIHKKIYLTNIKFKRLFVLFWQKNTQIIDDKKQKKIFCSRIFSGTVKKCLGVDDVQLIKRHVPMTHFTVYFKHKIN